MKVPQLIINPDEIAARFTNPDQFKRFDVRRGGDEDSLGPALGTDETGDRVPEAVAGESVQARAEALIPA